nr:uncharacterized protein LOC127348036 [Lolium perenne]
MFFIIYSTSTTRTEKSEPSTSRTTASRNQAGLPPAEWHTAHRHHHLHHHHHPGAGQFPPEVDANGLPLHSSPADNVATAHAALANLPDTGEGVIFVQHAKALVAKALEQQHAAADSQGRIYSRSSASRVASSTAVNRAIANINNCPPPAPRAAHSSNN